MILLKITQINKSGQQYYIQIRQKTLHEYLV